MSVRLAEEKDFAAIKEIYAKARSFMKKTGNPTQWGDSHPLWSLIEDDFAKGELYVIEREGAPHGVFALKAGIDPTYVRIEGKWLSETPYLTIHSLASDGMCHGIFQEALAFAKTKSGHLRIDTHADNAIMRKLIAASGFSYCGVCREMDGTTRLCYELIADK